MDRRGPATTGRLPVAERQIRLHTLYDATVLDVYRHVHRRCGDVSLAEDVTQDVFMTVARSDVDPQSVTIAWLKTVARNRMVDALRRRETYDRKLRMIGEAADQADPSSAIAEQLLVASAIEALVPLHRAVLMLHYVDGLSVSELARTLGRSAKGAEALITRARAALKKELEDLDA